MARPLEPKRGRLFVWSGTSLVAKLIQRFTESRWSHAGWFVSEDRILDADWNGVAIRPAAPYLEHPERLEILDIPLAEDVIESALRHALNLGSGAAYDYRLIGSLALHLIRGRRCYGEAREGKDAFVCSELIAQPLWEVAGFRFVPPWVDIDYTTPEDIARRLRIKC